MCALAGAWAPASSLGATLTLHTGETAAPPVLAGGYVVWAEATPNMPGGTLVVNAAGPDGRIRQLIGFSPVGPDEAQGVARLAGSDTGRVAFVRTVHGYPTELWVGSTAGGFVRLDDPCGVETDTALEGDVLVYGQVNVDFACGQGQLVLVNLTTGESTRLAAAWPVAEFAEPALAGRFLAWRDHTMGVSPNRDEIVVYDLVAGAEAYRVDTHTLTVPPGAANYRFALQADGKVAAAFVDAGQVQPGSHVVWFSPAEPFAHRPAVDLATPDVSLADDKLVGCRRDRADYAVMDLEGRTLNQFDGYDSTWGCPRVAFDGRQLGWLHGHRGTLHLADYPAQPPAAARIRPVITPPGSAASVEPTRFLSVGGSRVACPDGGGVCAVNVRLRHGRRVIGRAAQRVLEGEHVPVRARLSRRAARRLRAGPERVEAVLVASNRRGNTRLSTRLTLRRAP